MTDVLVRDDPKLSHIEVAFSRRRAKEFFNVHVMPHAFPGWRASELTQRRVRYKPGKECRVHYRVRVSNGERSEGRVATVTFRPGERLARVVERRKDLGEKRVFVEELDCLVEFFPVDWRIPGLRLAVDPEALTEHLHQHAGGRLRSATVARARMLRYRPGFSCVVLCQTEPDTPGPGDFIGKVYNKERVAREVASKLELLSSPAAEAGLTIPHLLHWSAAEHLVLMERAPGLGMDRLLFGAASQKEGLATIVRAAEALAQFHSLPFEGPITRTVEWERKRLFRRMRRISRVAGSLSRRARNALRPVDSQDLSTPEQDLCLIHGDFKPDQLLLQEGHTALVDLDRAGIGDPAVDVGNFTAALRKQAVINGYDGFLELAEAFVDRYLSLRPDEGIARRARAFQHIAMVRMALAKFERGPRSYARAGEAWPWLAVIDEAERCLAGS